MANQFLNSKSMATPGAIGGVIMSVTNALTLIIAAPPALIALGLSFLGGTLVFADRSMVLWQRGVFYVFNSLIIFAVAVGMNEAGKSTSGSGGEVALLPELHFSVFNSAHAASTEAGQPSQPELTRCRELLADTGELKLRLRSGEDDPEQQYLLALQAQQQEIQAQRAQLEAQLAKLEQLRTVQQISRSPAAQAPTTSANKDKFFKSWF